MKFNDVADKAKMNSMLYHDNSALTSIRHSQHNDEALAKVAGQFEAMFLQLVLKQMRASNDVLAEKDSPFSSQSFGVFRDMHDGQLSIEMARKGHLGIADMLVKQLSPSITEAHFEPRANQTSANDEHHDLAEIVDDVSAAFHSVQETVASVKQILSESSVTTAFAQPLVRKMEF
ncbi:rod-binding protein [Vibrio caribbeanicus]|uniref:Putative flagellar protein n=1 Tax=Vibrio caribbeanicus ATCC BAA-2122 TaxID=796620 RepID=E3BPF2_9VIBR|nr:rod-binding protein [Vibrio caribbeanicus]EFP95041.1 putative flagellar protein [Vibrio caribbeanicus ATCC BAA-2122]MCY9843016.1 rod-binding protein [Vibrio caribbeanicus]